MIDVKKLYFSYTDKPFVENVSFHVGRGEIFGFLGPSGNSVLVQKLKQIIIKNL